MKSGLKPENLEVLCADLACWFLAGGGSGAGKSDGGWSFLSE